MEGQKSERLKEILITILVVILFPCLCLLELCIPKCITEKWKTEDKNNEEEIHNRYYKEENEGNKENEL